MIEEIFNLRKATPQYWTAGQPTEAQLCALKEEGFQRVVNVAPLDPRYSLDDEELLVRSLGMTYDWIPIDFKKPTLDDYHSVEQALLDAGSERVFLHCAANFRATTVFGCFAVRHLDWSCDDWEALVTDVWDIKNFPVWVAYKASLSALTQEETP